MRDTVAYLLAGGVGSRLNILGWMRAKPAVPFGGTYRIIDFTLSNIFHSGINQVGILTQYKPYSLMGHIGSGAAWDFMGRSRKAKILPPSTGISASDWYRGTADAVAQNISFAERFHAKNIMLLSGDHIYKMDYNPLVEFHQQKRAEITIAMMRVPWEDTHHFGIAITDEDDRIIDWQEKPKNAKNNLASMGVYVFNFEFLKNTLENRTGHDFGKNVINDAYQNHCVYAYPFNGYWADVGTLRAYWNSNMDILRPGSGLDLAGWKVRSSYEEEATFTDRPPTRVCSTAKIENSLISNGCVIEGKVMHSILSPGVRIGKGAQVVDSVVMHDAVIENNATLYDSIIDKRVHVGAGSQIGVGQPTLPNEKFPDHLDSGLVVIGKDAQIPMDVQIFRNTIIAPKANERSFSGVTLKVGSYIPGPEDEYI